MLSMPVLTDPALLERYSHDETQGLETVLAVGVVQPESTAQVQEIVRYALQNNLALTPRGAGTGKAGGCVPSKNSLVIDFSKMNKILEISPENLIAKIQPGVILQDFKQALETENLFYPPDPNSLQWCSLGGNVATNAAGPSALKYGSTRDYVLGLEVVLANGETMRLGKQTVKGVAGYDLVSLICGSEGTLALVTEITVQLLPKPRNIQTALLRFDSNKQALEAVNHILALGYLPKTLEYMDSVCMQGRPALIAEFDGGEELDFLSEFDTQIALDEKRRRAIWEQRRLMSEQLKKRARHKISEDIVVPRNQMLAFTAEFEKLGLKHGVQTASFGHAGDGNLHAQFLFDEELEAQKTDQILGELFKLTIRLNGTISGEHGVGLAKKAYLPLEQSLDVIALQKAIKQVWDPKDILNPGKIFS
ncbi:MAG: FAD-linked oxidase C-terminal domain-containing protein [Myxococcaceae bacterium]